MNNRILKKDNTVMHEKSLTTVYHSHVISKTKLYPSLLMHSATTHGRYNMKVYILDSNMEETKQKVTRSLNFPLNCYCPILKVLAL